MLPYCRCPKKPQMRNPTRRSCCEASDDARALGSPFSPQKPGNFSATNPNTINVPFSNETSPGVRASRSLFGPKKATDFSATNHQTSIVPFHTKYCNVYKPLQLRTMTRRNKFNIVTSFINEILEIKKLRADTRLLQWDC